MRFMLRVFLIFLSPLGLTLPYRHNAQCLLFNKAFVNAGVEVVRFSRNPSFIVRSAIF